MNRKLSDFASIAEITSGIAVVVTLIFLVVGINENTRATYAGNYQLLQSEINNISLTVAQDDALSEARSLFESGGWEALDELGTFRVRNLERSLLRVYETAYYANSHGTLDAAEWIRFVQQICRRRGFHNDEQWELVAGILSDEFNAFVGSACPP